MTSADPIPQIASLGLEPTYSARRAAALLGRSYSWLDQRLRRGQFVRPDGTLVQPLRTPGGYRRFTTAMLRDIATSSYRQHWFSMDKLKSTFLKLARATYDDTGECPLTASLPLSPHRLTVQPAASTVRVRDCPFAHGLVDNVANLGHGDGRPCHPPRTASSRLWEAVGSSRGENTALATVRRRRNCDLLL
jgi:hypothetical protein